MLNDEEASEKKTRIRGLFLKMSFLFLRAGTWIGAILLTRMLKQCDHKVDGKPSQEVIEATITQREESIPERANQSVTR